MAKRVILSDQSVPNHHGFYVDHATLDMSRFNGGNPVLLYMHIRGQVHGKWLDWKFEGPQLTAEPEFDVDDPESNKLAGKFERGYIIGASLYLAVTDKTEFVQDETGKVWMKYAEVWEASLVDIPSNKNSLSVKLFADGKEVNEEGVKAFMLSASAVKAPEIEVKPEIKSNNTMSKIISNAIALAALTAHGLHNADSPEDVEGAVIKLSAAFNAEKTAHALEKKKREELEATIKEQENVQLSAMLDQAVTDGQIMGEQKETFAALGLSAAKKIIEGLPKAVKLGANNSTNTSTVTGADPKTKEEFFKLSTDEQLAFKNTNMAGYMALFAE